MITIQQLYIKTESGQAMKTLDQLILEKNGGIIGDKSAKIGGPRQILISTVDGHNQLGIQLDQLRSNIVLDGISLAEINSGDELQIGETKIRITYICEPCRHLFEVADFITDDRKTLNKERGILGIVTQSGTIHQNEEVLIRKGAYKPLPDDNFARFCIIAKDLPCNKYISYNNIIFLMGAPKAYVRALPGYIKKAEVGGIDCSGIQAQEEIESLSKDLLRDFTYYFQPNRH